MWHKDGIIAKKYKSNGTNNVEQRKYNTNLDYGLQMKLYESTTLMLSYLHVCVVAHSNQ
jgi:hypothetical protein